VAVVGPNGAGKTTLVRMLVGQQAPDSGTVKLGTGLEVAYLDQTRAELKPEMTLREVLAPLGGDQILVRGKPWHVAAYAKSFLFTDAQLRQPVRSLSGGERNRLLLARVLAAPSNLLVLDEPTNDLDMDTLDLLEEALEDYAGTLLLVSHDRDFIDRLASSTIALDGRGRVVETPGGWTDFMGQNPGFFEDRNHANVCEAFGRPTAQGQTDAGRPFGGALHRRRRWLDRRWRKPRGGAARQQGGNQTQAREQPNHSARRTRPGCRHPDAQRHRAFSCVSCKPAWPHAG
jgi:ATP-binding cassette subfamily F protein uup